MFDENTAQSAFDIELMGWKDGLMMKEVAGRMSCFNEDGKEMICTENIAFVTCQGNEETSEGMRMKPLKDG